MTNPKLSKMDQDCLYHLGLGNKTHDLPAMFGDVKFVCMGGAEKRMESFANLVLKELDYELPTGACLENISCSANRFAMFKVGPVLSISHGMGVPSLSILLHEVIKLLQYAGAQDPQFFRIGTSGGVGVEGGTVVVTRKAVSPKLENFHKNTILGEDKTFPAILDKKLTKDLVQLGRDLGIKTVEGDTVCTGDFYEGQGRLDGAFCEYGEKEKMKYLEYLHNNGVSNIEMEATCFAAMTHRAGIRAAIVCSALLNRLKGNDQVSIDKEDYAAWTLNPQKIVLAHIKKSIKESS